MFMLFIGQVLAATVPVTICAQYDVIYDDADPSYGDDYVTTDGIYPARGVRLWVVRDSDGVKIKDAYASDSGTNAGCLTTLTSLDTTKTYTITMFSEAKVNNNTLRVTKTDDESVYQMHTHSVSFTPSLMNTSITLTAPAGDAGWNIANVVGHAMWRRSLGLTGEFFRFVSQGHPTAHTAYNRD